MKKKQKFYTILSKVGRRQYGVFQRSKEGLKLAKQYKEKLVKENQIDFVIK